jgi:hypothetical protein
MFFLHSRVTGTFFDAFEYYLEILNLNPNIYLTIINGTRKGVKDLINLYNERYNIENSSWTKNILSISKYDLLKIKYDKVLVFGFDTVYHTKGILQAKEIYVVCGKHSNNPKYRYSKDNYNVTYYGEMPFHKKDKNYKMKFLFNRFKHLKEVHHNIYIYSPRNRNYSFVKNLNLPKKSVIIRDENKCIGNVFELFDTYVYYHANKWFDPTPRMLIEAYWYGKEIIYVNDYDIRDGSWYRYKDLQENGLKNRNLDSSDELVRLMV